MKDVNLNEGVKKTVWAILKGVAVQLLGRLLHWLKSDQGVFVLAFAATAAIALASCSASGATLAGAMLIAGTAGGKHAVEGVLTQADAEEAAPGLLRNEIDRRIVKLRPMATPIDQLSRWAGARNAGSMVVEYYSVDTRPVEGVVTTAVAGHPSAPEGSTGKREAKLTTADNRIFAATTTVLCPDVKVKNKRGLDEPLVLYVRERCVDGVSLEVTAVNGVTQADGSVLMPVIPANARLIRMGRAAGELDVQTPQFEALPHKERNNCQIFKAQIEQATLMRLRNKEVGWTFSDQEEVAIYDMRLGMEKSFLFGACQRFNTGDGSDTEVFTTGGIWNQAGQEATYVKGAMNTDIWVGIMRKAFTGNGGSSRKILVGGSGLIEALNTMDAVKVVGAMDTVTKWGLDFHEIHSKFGTLYVIMSEVFDLCGHADDGMIIDPEYLTKYSHVPFTAERLDLKSSGQRNTDAVVLTEASCLVLRYPTAHTRITAVSE